jgi:hypothetical protein
MLKWNNIINVYINQLIRKKGKKKSYCFDLRFYLRKKKNYYEKNIINFIYTFFRKDETVIDYRI